MEAQLPLTYTFEEIFLISHFKLCRLNDEKTDLPLWQFWVNLSLNGGVNLSG